jgi:hypothetical protein
MSGLVHNGSPPQGADVTDAGVRLLERQDGRKYVGIVNTSATFGMYLALNDSATGSENQAIVGNGIYLAPNGGSYEINESNMYKGEIWAIHADAGNTHRATIQRGS